MIEVIITSIIFVLATAGILSTISMLRPQGGEAIRKVEAAYVGKRVLDELRKEVDATAAGYYGAGLSLGGHSSVIDGYTVDYTVTAPSPNLLRVDMTVTWPDI